MNLSFDNLTECQKIHLAILVVSKGIKENNYPLQPWNQESIKEQTGTNLYEVVKSNKVPLQNLREQLESLKPLHKASITDLNDLQSQAQALLLKITEVENWKEFADKQCDYQIKEFKAILAEVEQHLNFKNEKLTDSAAKKSRAKRHKKKQYTPPE